MANKYGRLSVNFSWNDPDMGSDSYDQVYAIYEIDNGDHKYTFVGQDGYEVISSQPYIDLDWSNTTELDAVFAEGYTNTYTWLTPMTEVDDEAGIEFPISIANGGTGATTAAEALANLGAASATALDALSDTVAGKANVSHEHTEYATTATVDALEDAINSKANAIHTHTEYAAVSHTHSDYATISALDELSDVVDGKAASNHSHSNYALTGHNHDTAYASLAHTHDYAASSHTHSNYATVSALDELSDTVDGKANVSHSHVISDVANLQSALDGKASVSHNHDTDYAASGHTHDDRYYTETEVDSKVSVLETSIAGKANNSHTHTIANVTNLQTKLDSIDDAIDGKADSVHSHSDYSLTTHNHDGVYAEADHTHNYAASSHSHSVATTAADGFMSAADKTKLSGIATGAEVNQNAFSNVVIGATTIAADAETDTLTLVAGSNVTMTPDATNDKITIAATDTVYTHPTYTARTGVPAANQTPGFGGTFSVTQPVSDGSGHITAMNSRTVTIPSTAATTSAAGLMSAADKTKLDGIATGANNYTYTLPSAGSSLGGVKTGGDVTISDGTITVNDDSHNHVISNVDGLQTVLDGKAASSHTHNYAGSSSAGGAATSANKLATARIISLTGDVTGSTSFDGSADASIVVTVADDSHNHVISNVDGLQSALDGKAASEHTHDYLPLAGGTVTGNVAIGGSLDITGSTIIRNTTDVGASFAGGEPLIVGNPEDYHITFDGTEIQCKSNATTAGNISINYDGGDVGLGGGTGKVIPRVPMYFPNETVIYGRDTDGTYMSVFSAASYADNTAVGYDRYHYNDEGKGNLNLYGKDIRLWSRDGNLVAQPLGVNRVLWEGGMLMTADHTITLTNTISSQITGVVLVWSCYSNNTVQNFGYATHFIPKWFVNTRGGSGMDFPLMRQSAGKVGSKYLYIHDGKIVGQANNNASGTNNGITYDNSYWVLRAVIGV